MKSDDMRIHAMDMGSRRWGRVQQDGIADPYFQTHKPKGGAVCPDCHAFFTDGRWTWSKQATAGAEELCPACRRIRDRIPAGILTLSGAFVGRHKQEMLDIIRRQEILEKQQHPLNRIMEIGEEADKIVVETTDIHLPQRVGKACESAYDGELTMRHDQNSYFVRVDWRREN
jgi:hypothetical protein